MAIDFKEVGVERPEEKYSVGRAEEQRFHNEVVIIPADSSDAYREQLVAHLRKRADITGRQDIIPLVEEAEETARKVHVVPPASILGNLHRAEAILLGVSSFEMDMIIHTEQARRAWGIVPEVKEEYFESVFNRRREIALELGRYGPPTERKRALHAIATRFTVGLAEHLDEPSRTLMVDHIAEFAGPYYDVLVRRFLALKQGELGDQKRLSDLAWSGEVALNAVAMAQFNKRASTHANLRRKLLGQGDFGKVVMGAVNALDRLRERATVLFSPPSPGTS